VKLYSDMPFLVQIILFLHFRSRRFQLFVSATRLLVKFPSYSSNGILVGPHSWSRRFGGDKTYCFSGNRTTIPRSSSPYRTQVSPLLNRRWCEQLILKNVCIYRMLCEMCIYWVLCEMLKRT